MTTQTSRAIRIDQNGGPEQLKLVSVLTLALLAMVRIERRVAVELVASTRPEAPILIMLFLVQWGFDREAPVLSPIQVMVVTIVVVSEEAALQTTWALATLLVGPVVVTVVVVAILARLFITATAVVRTMEAQRRSTPPLQTLYLALL